MLSNMSSLSSSRFSLRRFAAVLILSYAATIGFTAHAVERTVFNNSLVTSNIGVASRDAMTAADMAAQVEFLVSLKMRSFDELSTRLAKGELISNAEMIAKYYPLDADYQAQVTWLKSQGLTITMTDPCRLGIFVSGTAAQVQQALQTSFAKVSANGQTYTSAVAAPSLPATIAAPVLGINGLQPHIQAHKHSIKANPQVGSRENNAPPYYPSEIIKAYSGSGLTVNGSGQTIGIVIDTFPSTTDLTAFWKQAGISQSLNNVSFIQVVSGTLAKPSGEETLDTEWTSGIASGAKIRVYAAFDLAFNHLDQCYQRIINDLPSQPSLHQVSISLGLDETDTGVSQMQTDAQYFASLAAGGVSVFVSTGDDGSHPSSSGRNLGPLQVEYPSSDPSVTAVGGTSINLSGTGTVSSESAWSDTGGGISGQFSRPSFQVGSGLPSGTFRLTPDIAAPADPDTGALVYLDGSAQQYGGTSWSAPTWAGFCAMINQARANAGLPPVGLLGKSIYPLLGSSSFRDITTGNNGPSGQYNATTGFDLCTGIGVPNLSNLVQALSQGGTPPPSLPNLTNDGSVAVTLPTTVVVGANLTVSTGVLNNGTAAAGSFIVRYRLSTSQNFDTSGAALGDVTISSLAVNGKAAATFTGVCPTVAAGNYYLVWSIDANNTVAESNESDNIFASSTQIAVTTGSTTNNLPNLTLDPSAAVVAPTTVVVGANLTVSTGVINNGTAAAGSFVVRYRLSTSQNFDTSGAALGDATVASLAVNGTATATFTGTCPTLAAGNYYLVWFIDANNTVTESNENDNTFFGATQIAVTIASTGSGLPNLTLDRNASIVCPTTMTVGAPLTITTTVLNNGTGSAGQFIVRYRLSVDTVYSSSSDALIGDASINGLAPGATAAATYAGTVPNVTPGTYYLIWSIDALGQVAESNENDNLWYYTTPITVTNGTVNHPPVIVSGPSFTPQSPTVNTPVSFSVAASDADNNPLTYTWNFGDGGSGSGTAPTHTYTTAGTYTVSVTVTDGKGGSVSGGVSVTVTSPVSTTIAEKKTFTLNFIRANDTLDLLLFNNAFNTVVTDGQMIRLVVGGQTLDYGVFFRGKANGAYGKFTYNARNATIEYVSRAMPLQGAVAPYGAIDANISGETINIPMAFSVGGTVYGNTYSFFYSAIAGRSGKGF